MVSYTVQLHPMVERELQDTPDGDRIADVLCAVSEHRKPTNHPKCTVLNNNHTETVYKIRVGDYRLFARLEKPELKVLHLARRQNAYENIDDIYAAL